MQCPRILSHPCFENEFLELSYAEFVFPPSALPVFGLGVKVFMSVIALLQCGQITMRDHDANFGRDAFSCALDRLYHKPDHLRAGNPG